MAEVVFNSRTAIERSSWQSGATNIDYDDDKNVVSFGVMSAQIVGIRYYRGTVNKNEMVALVREPRNPYDSNAVRVDNVSGVQVGHIKREQALAVAKIVDKKLARIEG